MKFNSFNRVRQSITQLLKQTTSWLSYKYPYAIPIVERGISEYKGSGEDVSEYSDSSLWTRKQRGNHTLITRNILLNACYKAVATVLLLMAIGVGNAWGATITLNQTALGLTGSYTTGSTATISGVEFTYSNLMKNNTDIQAKASSGELWNSTIVPGKITNIAATHTGTARSSNLYWGTTAKATTNSGSVSGTFSKNSPSGCFGYFYIKRGSNAAYWSSIVITYTPATITLSPTSLTALDYAVGSGPSAAKTFTISGSNIPANLIVTAPTNFQVSKDGSSWATTQTISVTTSGSTGGTLASTTIYVRLASGKSAGNYSGNVSVAIDNCNEVTGVSPKTVAVSGTVTAAATKYTVTLDANGGSVTPASVAQTSAGASVTLPTPTRTGYTCSGWYTATSGGTKRANAGGSYTPTANETVHAQWTADEYTLTLDKGTGGSANGTAKVLYDATSLKSITHATHASKSLTGYYTEASGGTKVLNADGTFASAAVSGYITSSKWSRTSATTLYAQWADVPTITVNQTTRAFGDKKVSGGPYTMTFTVSGTNLTGNITLAKSGTNAAMFSIDKTSLTQSAGSVSTTTIIVSYSPTAAGNHTATITISSSGATSKTVALTGTGKWEVTWNNNGSTSTSLVSNGTKPTFPSTPASCDATSTTFIGWATAAWTGKIANLTGKTVYTSADDMPAVDGNVTYYAVWAKQGTGGSDGSISLTYSSFGYTSTTYSEKTATVNGIGFTCNQGCRGNFSSILSLQMNSSKGTGSLYNTDAISGLKSITLKCNSQNSGKTATVYQGTSSNPTTNSAGTAACAASTDYTINITSGEYFTIKVSGATYFSEIIVTYSSTTYSDYLTTCCTSLGAINGSISLTNESNC